jgi:hypothetical protein
VNRTDGVIVILRDAMFFVAPKYGIEIKLPGR